MKPLLLIIVLLFSTPAWAEWEFVTSNDLGDEYFVEFEKMRKNKGFIYYWRLGNYLKPSKFGDMSSKIYVQADCNKFREQILSVSFYKQPNGVEQSVDSYSPSPQWDYPPPNSSGEFLLKEVCRRAGN